ncbi:hypothetical protein [Streptomyces sp. NPDC047706]|uniref:hypothetical protein n=1 Tax=Streptomyces sp. NPDC047706 TaxID=3365486 RepID=UPI0037190668
MTLATLLMPIRVGFLDRRPVGRHRALDEVARQHALRAGADLLIKALRQQLDDQEITHADVVTRIDERHAEVVAELQRQIAELKRRLDISAKAQAAADQTQPIPVLPAAVRVMPLGQAPFATADPGRT